MDKSLKPEGTEFYPNYSELKSLFLTCYEDLSSIASKKLRYENNAATLDTSALVHEAYLKMEKHRKGVKSKSHFLAIAAIVMRRFLVDYARQKQREKRGGDQIQLTYGTILSPVETTPQEILNLNEALKRLKLVNNRYCRIVEFHFFGGYKHEEIAEFLGVSIDTVRRDWRLAKAWLSKELAPST
jgi:RNA polymerase sigma factor (TIGR02999 family)